MIDHLNKRASDLIPPNTKQVLSSLAQTECTYKKLMSVQELAYYVMDLPPLRRSFSEVKVIGFYNRARLAQSYMDKKSVIYSDRTEYAAYAERCNDSVLLTNVTKEEIANMCFIEFAETVKHEWKQKKNVAETVVDPFIPLKLQTRDATTGHWKLSHRRKRIHVRPSTVLYTDPASEYELVDVEATTSQTKFFQLSRDKRRQLYRSYYELVMFKPWTVSPDETFLTKEVQEILSDKKNDPEAGDRYSLMRLEEFFKVYMHLWNAGEVAQPGTRWHRDNQFSYSMFLTNGHNTDIRLERNANSGRLNAQFEPAEELDGTGIQIRPAIFDEADDYEFPSVMNFLPPDTFREIMEQAPPVTEDVNIAFPLQNNWQSLEELVTIDKSKRFLANPPSPPIEYEKMTDLQKWVVDLVLKKKQKIVYICGKAGCGKTTVALKICEELKGKVQAGACTGKVCLSVIV